MDENDPLSEYNKIPLGHNRSNCAVSSKINIKVDKTIIENFTLVTTEELSKIISCMNKTTCASDPFPTRLLISYLPIIIDVILYIVNLCITTNVFLYLVNHLL